MSSRELGDSSSKLQKSAKQFTELPHVGSADSARESDVRNVVPYIKESDKREESLDVSGAKFSKTSEKPSESRKPEAAAGNSGDKPPIDIPPPGSTAESPEERPGKDLENLMEYVSESEHGTLRRLFVADVKGELSTIEQPEETDSLAAFDTSTTEKGKLQFDQGLVATQYQQTLESSGLAFSNDVFSSSLKIVDGQRFTDTLAAISEENETLIKGVKNVVDHSLATIVMAHVPSVVDEEAYETSHLHPTLQADVTGETTSTMTETLLHANTIADQLQRLGVDEQTVKGLKNIHTAELEGMLPEWAVAQSWDLYNSHSDPRSSEWRQWAFPEEWQKFHEFFDKVAAKAPKDSKFFNDLAEGMLTNIKNVRREMIPSVDLPISEEYLDDINLPEAPETYAQMEEYDREYDELLTAAEQKLSDILSKKKEGKTVLPTESELSKESDIPELPTVKQIGDTFVVGVDHRAKPVKNLPEDYVHALNSADHLLLEGTEYGYGRQSNNYERLAHNTFSREKGKATIHFLEEGADIEGLLVESGMKKDVATLYGTLNMMIPFVNNRGWLEDESKMEADIPIVSEYLKRSSSVFSEMSKDQLRVQLEKCMKGVSKMTNEVGTAYSIINTYASKMRDSGVIGPRVTQLMGELSGKKAIFGGKNHTPAIEKAVRGEQIESPPLWPEYINRLSDEEKDALEAFSALAELKEKNN